MSEHEEQHGGHGHGGGHGPPHGGGHEEGHEGAPEWLISFADNVALMMGFFVILLAMNLKPANAAGGGGAQPGETTSPEEAMLDMAIAIREAFNNPVDIDTADPRDESLVERMRARLYGVARDKGADGDYREVLTIRPGQYHSEGAHVTFARNTAELSDAAKAAVKTLAGQARGMRSVIEIRGHVSAAESYKKENHGVELSYERAFKVAREFVANGIEWERLRLIACADTELVVKPAYDEADHLRNQRAEIIFSNNAAEEAAKQKTPESAPGPQPIDSPASSEPRP